jgi:Domain of unknown function (DUF4390)
VLAAQTRALVLLLILFVSGGGSLLARAAANETIEIRNVTLSPSSDGDSWVLAADFAIPLPHRLEEAINQGVALYFVIDLEIYRPRWYWWDFRLVQNSQTYRLSYHALTRQYRVSINGYQQSFSTLTDALRSVSVVRAWKVMESDRPKAGVIYDAYLRLRLDLTQLPKPFQITALTNRDWNLQAEWKHFIFSPETPKSAQ